MIVILDPGGRVEIRRRWLPSGASGVDGIPAGTESSGSNVTLFHVKHAVSLQQLLNVGLQGGHNELATNLADDRQQPAEILTVQFRCRVVEQ